MALLNRGSRGSDITMRARDLGLLDTPKHVRNVWKQADIADFTEAFIHRLEPRETILLKVTGGKM